MMAALADLRGGEPSSWRPTASADAVSYDLAEVRDLDYYTGVTFEGFAPGIGFSLISGGRYDDLIGHFGPPFPAVGWALTLDRMLLARELQGYRHAGADRRRAAVGHVGRTRLRQTAWRGPARRAKSGIAVTLDLGRRSRTRCGSRRRRRARPRIVLHRNGTLIARDAHGERRFAAGDWAEVDAMAELIDWPASRAGP